MTVRVRRATAADIHMVAQLIEALYRHYQDANDLGMTGIEQMLRACFASCEGTRFAVAEVNGAAAGLAAYTILRPGRTTRGLLFVKDLFVLDSHRSAGVGAAIMGWLGGQAAAAGIGRVELLTAQENDGARRFYDRLGGEAAPRIMYRFKPDALAAFNQGEG